MQFASIQKTKANENVAKKLLSSENKKMIDICCKKAVKAELCWTTLLQHVVKEWFSAGNQVGGTTTPNLASHTDAA